MSILENIFNGLLGGNEENSNTQAKPCSNCPANCEYFPAACNVCSEYKKKLIDQLYYVDHLEEYYNKYEIAGSEADEVYVGECPYCGATNPGGNICQYCGSALREGTVKIRVERASDIPDPIQLAQDIIFQRQEAVTGQSEKDGSGLLDALVGLVSGSNNDTNVLGSRMSTDEIKSMAEKYGVSVSQYLQGLDNGTYLSLSAKEKENQHHAAAYTAAGGTMLSGLPFGNRREEANTFINNRPKPPRPEQRPQQPDHHGFPMQGSRPGVPGRPGSQEFNHANRSENGPHSAQGYGKRPGPASHTSKGTANNRPTPPSGRPQPGAMRHDKKGK